MKIFAHRGMYGCTDIDNEHLIQEDVKGENLKNIAPENSEASILAAFNNGFGVEIDVVMTKDRQLLITHTNDLSLHSLDAKPGDYVSEKNLDEILSFKTGKGGQTSAFLTYDRLIELLHNYPSYNINIEIKGNIQPQGGFAELNNPNIVEKLVETTPSKFLPKIIWSSFAISNLIEMRKLLADANVAMLFSPQDSEEIKIYPDKNDKYLKFNMENLEFVLGKIDNINAVHPCSDSLDNLSLLKLCNDKMIDVRPWSLKEKNPLKNPEAKDKILRIVQLQQNFMQSNYDIITDFPLEVKSLIMK